MRKVGLRVKGKLCYFKKCRIEELYFSDFQKYIYVFMFCSRKNLAVFFNKITYSPLTLSETQHYKEP